MCKQSILEVGTSLSLNKAGITGLLGSFRTDQSGFFLKWEVVDVDTVFCAEHVSTTITAFDSSCSYQGFTGWRETLVQSKEEGHGMFWKYVKAYALGAPFFFRVAVASSGTLLR